MTPSTTVKGDHPIPPNAHRRGTTRYPLDPVDNSVNARIKGDQRPQIRGYSLIPPPVTTSTRRQAGLWNL